MLIQLAKIPIAEVGMLIRKPAEEVYRAFVDPEITTKFWFTKSSGRLEQGRRIVWEWGMYGVATTLEVTQLEPGKHILLDWNLENHPDTVEWTFTPMGSEATFVSIKNYGFSGDGDTVVAQAMDSAYGFTLVLAGLKAYLEHGIKLNLISDRFPDRNIDITQH